MTASAPHVSVVIPTFNRAGFIASAVRSCLMENTDNCVVEVIVVDDGSSDDTSGLMEEFGQVRYIPLDRNYGRNRARNTGLRHAQGTYIKFLDSDDMLVPGSLGTEVAAAFDAKADVVASGWREIEMVPGAEGRVLGIYAAPQFDGPVVDDLLAGKAVPTGAALYARSLVADLAWDESLRKLDDWDWFIRSALRASKIISTTAISYTWVQHPGQGIRSETMLNNAREHHIILKKMEAHLAESGLLTDARKKRLAQYFYKELRVLCLNDRPAFHAAIDHIDALDPAFSPTDEEAQQGMRLLCRLLGTRNAILLHSTAKRLARRT
jgi:glycosyltransferase involved in cell wall biosynthesis